MKKSLFLASALVMGMMSSCSNDVENVSVPGAELQPIELSVGSPSIVVSPTTKGVGTVGDLTSSEQNVWNGEDLYVIMMRKYYQGQDDWSVSQWTQVENIGQAGQPVINFNNLLVQAPTGENKGSIVVPDATAKYYPADDSKHAFFAYHIDDAAANASYEPQGAPTLVDDAEAKTRSVYFNMDGSQDLMLGEAIPSQEDEAGISFSAKSARQGIVPQLQMKHMLSRLTFEVKGGDATAQSLTVNKITVYSKHQGKMCVAYFSNPGELISFDESVIGLDLKQRAAANTQMTALTPMPLTEEFQKIGESLMIAPGEEAYDIVITTTQDLGQGKSNIFEHKSKIEIDGTAKTGSSYNVKITLYGLSEINVEAHLAGWNNGGDITVNPSDNI